MATSKETKESLLVSQCVAKRARQLERLQFMFETTVRKFVCAIPSHSGKSALSYSQKAVVDTQSAYLTMLFRFLQQEERTCTPQLFNTALPLEDYEGMMPRLLELQDEEEHVSQRTELHWQVLRRNVHADFKVQELLTKCEHKWLAPVYGTAYLQPTISKIQEHHDDKTPLKDASNGFGDDGEELRPSQNVFTPASFCMRPVAVVNHRLSWAPLTAKIYK
ncbi:hypothetical protein FI667_g9541, partial [Globisporangium splendens]